MKRIAVIGGGFSGTMTIVHLIEKTLNPIEIILITEKENQNIGIAYNTYSDTHLLNVTTGNMSAYSNKPDDFLDWVMLKDEFRTKDKTLISQSFLPRKLYGEYLNNIWEKALKTASEKNIKITLIHGLVNDLDVTEDGVSLSIENLPNMQVHQCVIASGNHIPRNPKIRNMDFYSSKNYFQNPWKEDCVKNCSSGLPVLIIGNGLTMVDTVFGLLEQGFRGEIFSISPNGYNILQHRHGGLKYTKLVEELEKENYTLYDLIKKVHQHIKTVRAFGVSAEPIIDSLRTETPKIWKSFTDQEKSVFMSRFRHLWGVARHRIPLHSHDKIQQLRINGQLHIISGKIIDFKEEENHIEVEYFDKKEHKEDVLNVSRIINCTGPETDLMNLENHFLKKCLLKGILTQDQLKLGICTDTETYQIINSDNKKHRNLFTLGPNLKGELWESTAVKELREQAEELAKQLISG